MDEEIKSEKPAGKASLAAFIDHPEAAQAQPKIVPHVAEVPPPGGRRRDSRPVVHLTVVGLFIALSLGLIAFIAWDHMRDHTRPHGALYRLKMVVVGEPK